MTTFLLILQIIFCFVAGYFSKTILARLLKVEQKEVSYILALVFAAGLGMLIGLVFLGLRLLLGVV